MIGLWVFLALAIPIAVHIFSRSEGKVVPFPFLALLPKQAAPNELQIQLRQKWLLLVRLLLVASACALLTAALLSDWWSESWLKQSLSLPSSPPTLIITQDWWELSSPESQQVLLTALTSEQRIAQTEEVILIRYTNALEKISRLDKSDFMSLAQQNKVFAAANIGEAPSDTSESMMQLRLIDNIWSVVQGISTSLPEDSLIHVYTSNRQSQFTGSRPHINHTLQWHINNIPDNTNTEKEAIQLAIIGTKSLSDSSPTSFLLEQALGALTLIHPIDIDIIEADFASNTLGQAPTEKASASSALLEQDPAQNEKHEAINAKRFSYTNYDALIVDFPLSDIAIDYPNVVFLSSLPPPSEIEFIAALGQAVFAKKQHEQALFSAAISDQHIENNKSSGINNAAVISTLPNANQPPWQQVLTFVLLVLFILERLMSESLKFAQTTDTLDDHG